jgi:hypothetical protein
LWPSRIFAWGSIKPFRVLFEALFEALSKGVTPRVANKKLRRVSNTGAKGCTPLVIRSDTATPNAGDAVCGLALQVYQPGWVESRPNVAVYERVGAT